MWGDSKFTVNEMDDYVKELLSEQESKKPVAKVQTMDEVIDDLLAQHKGDPPIDTFIAKMKSLKGCLKILMN